MNEQIEKLAEQAGMHRDKFGMYFAGDKHDEDGVDLEKFAELIVEQCAAIIESQDVDPSFRNRMSWAVKQYFGVEE